MAGRGGRRAGAGRKKGDGLLQRQRHEWAQRAFDDKTEAQVDAALIWVACDPDHPQFVAAARLLKEFKHGKPAQMIRNAGENEYKAHMERLRALIVGDEPRKTATTETNKSSGSTVSAAAKSSTRTLGG